MLDHGWYGGCGFGEEKVEAGSYLLILECAGEKTEPLELIVERSDILKQIKAEFGLSAREIWQKALGCRLS
jgi:hypothetical protein